MKSDTKNNIGKTIKMLRKEQNLKQIDLANRLEVKQSTVSRWENGVDEPSSDKLPTLIDLFGITYNELYQNELSENSEERELLNNYRKLSEVKKLKIKQLINSSGKLQENIDNKGYAQNEVEMLFYLLLQRGLSVGELKIILFDQIEKLEELNMLSRRSSSKNKTFIKTLDKLFKK